MNGAFVLILDKRVEISNKYKKILEQNYLANVLIVENEETFFEKLILYEPDLILISDSISDNSSDLCQKIRLKDFKFRPIIVLLSKSSFNQDKLNALSSGADDFLSEPLNSDEFSARINAHIRRTKEETSNFLTKLPNEQYCKKLIRRTLKTSKDWGMLLLGIDNFSSYKEIYGEIPANKLLQAYTAILKASIEHDDFVGQITSDNFLIITSSYKVEKLADYLNYAFDSIFRKFYSKEDNERNYILLHGANKSGCKIPIMTSSIGVINSELMSYADEIDIYNALVKVQKLAKLISGSSKVIDRQLICSDGSCIYIDSQTVLIIENDIDLSYLLETTMKIQGFTPVIYNNFDIDMSQIKELNPQFIIIDRGDNSNKSIELCRKIKTENTNSKILFTDTLHEKDEVLSAGADLYLPKPYDLMELFQWIYKLLD